MAFVITVAQQKGGAGKTMLAANLAVAFAATSRVALLDIDPQRSLSRWHGLRNGKAKLVSLHLSEVSGWRLAAELDRLRASHEVVLIDSPPQIETDARLAIRGADLVIVPVQPSLPDLWAAEGTLKLAGAERKSARIVLNRAPASGRLRDRVLAEISSNSHPAFQTVLGNRVGLASAFADGLAIVETSPKSVATRELRALLAEIEALRG
jgi:chromosome partitioning protein